MSKVTIKFWRVSKKEYESDPYVLDSIFVNARSHVKEYRDGCLYSSDDYEPHFFKDGERIA